MAEKKEIIEKAYQLFSKSGIRNNSMDDLAKAVGISKKTLYQNIPNKTELVEMCVKMQFNDTVASIENIKESSNNCIEQLIRFNGLIIKLINDVNPATIIDMQKLYQNIHDNWRVKFRTIFSKEIEDTIRRGKKNGLFHEDIDEKIITSIHTEKIDQMHDNINFLNSKQEWLDTIKKMVTYYIRGLVTPKGEEVLNSELSKFNEYIQ